MFYIIYRVRNMINGKYYIGAHKTNNLDDGYMGSGVELKKALEEDGVEHFQKEILYSLDSNAEMFNTERKIVNEDVVNDIMSYNLKVGGSGGWAKGKTVTNTGQYVSIDEFNNDKLKGVCYGKLPVIDNDGNTIQIDKDDYDPKKHTPTIHRSGTVSVYNSVGDVIKITPEEYLKGDYTHESCNMVSCKNTITGETSRVTKDIFDNTAELVGATSGRNLNPTIYHIFDREGSTRYVVSNVNFIKYLRERELPTALVISAQQGGRPIYQNVSSNYNRLKQKGMLEYVGWYAIKIK